MGLLCDITSELTKINMFICVCMYIYMWFWHTQIIDMQYKQWHLKEIDLLKFFFMTILPEYLVHMISFNLCNRLSTVKFTLEN